MTTTTIALLITAVSNCSQGGNREQGWLVSKHMQVGKILDVAQLIKETGWRSDWAEEYGGLLLTVIQCLVLSVLPTPALTISLQPEPAVWRRQLTCSKCNQEGHISKFYQVGAYLTANDLFITQAQIAVGTHPLPRLSQQDTSTSTSGRPDQTTVLHEYWLSCQFHCTINTSSTLHLWTMLHILLLSNAHQTKSIILDIKITSILYFGIVF